MILLLKGGPRDGSRVATKAPLDLTVYLPTAEPGLWLRYRRATATDAVAIYNGTRHLAAPTRSAA